MTRLNMSVEPLVREALGAAIGRDVDRCIAVLEKMIDSPQPNTAQDCLDLGAAIVASSLAEQYQDQRPRDNQLRALAIAFAQEEAWAKFPTEVARLYLLAIVDQQPVPPEAASEVLRITFVMGAWLLASFGPPQQLWYDRLDQVLWRLEDAEVNDDQDGGGAS